LYLPACSYPMPDIGTRLRHSLPRSIDISYPAPPTGRANSAVLIPLWEEHDAWKVLFTVRGQQLADHRGQVAFPGGLRGAGEAGPLQTALREACEEVGLCPDRIDPLGILHPVDTSTRYRIWPVVGILREPVRLHPARPEVQEAFWVPLAWLMERGRWKWKPVETGTKRKGHRSIFFEAYEGRVIWGATGIITRRLLEILRKDENG
jgi:8-oxo-dGTP pyrophosphatase MutT (NUDIX family)